MGVRDKPLAEELLVVFLGHQFTWINTSPELIKLARPFFSPWQVILLKK